MEFDWAVNLCQGKRTSTEAFVAMELFEYVCYCDNIYL